MISFSRIQRLEALEENQCGDARECLYYSLSKLGYTGGEGNGNPLQYSCLENPRDREESGSIGLRRVGHD